MSFRRNWFTYEEYLRPWKKKGKRECLKWPNGLRNFWERISPEEYDATANKGGGE